MSISKFTTKMKIWGRFPSSQDKNRGESFEMGLWQTQKWIFKVDQISQTRKKVVNAS